jgi:hypothetical protein
MFLHVQSIQTSKVDNPCFFQTFFLKTKCVPFLFKIGHDFNIDNYKGKRTCIHENYFITDLEHIWLKSVFDPKIYGF